jgi:predicted lipoprotein
MRYPVETTKLALCAIALLALASTCESSNDSTATASGTDTYVAPDSTDPRTTDTNDGPVDTTDEPGDDTPRVVEPQDARSEALASITNNVILATLTQFTEKTLELKTATATFSDTPSDANRIAAQSAWAAAIDVWQMAEVMQLGPAGVSGAVAAGQDLRDGIYSWNIVSACRVDRKTASGVYLNVDDYRNEAVNVHGLDALEYLLYNTNEDNACGPLNAINTDGTWANLTDLSSKRAAHSATVASILHDRAVALLDLWAPENGNFAGEVTGAGQTSMTYASPQEALNAVTDAMFYAEKTTKDMKLAIPLGISGCSTDTCPEDLESQYARRSKEHVRANMVAFQQLYLGGPADENHMGIDDVLVSVGADELANSITTGLVDSINAIDAIEGDLATALANNPSQVQAAFDATRTVMTLFKTQLMATLNLEVPARAASDND